jgi:hypothetical protein
VSNTLAFSIAIHALIVCGAIVAPIVATDELAEPRRGNGSSPRRS